jgi:hypothetical protein
MTDLAAFTASLAAAAPPPDLPTAVVALWHAARGEWDTAHGIAQAQEGDPAHDWVHAHLHRVEGDLGNAGYWYRRAGKPVGKGDLGAEREAIVAELLSRD